MRFASPHSGSQLTACLAGVSYTDTFESHRSLIQETDLGLGIRRSSKKQIERH